MKYFAFTDDQKIRLIGEFEHISDAMDREPGNAVWIFSETDLRALGIDIAKALLAGSDA